MGATYLELFWTPGPHKYWKHLLEKRYKIYNLVLALKRNYVSDLIFVSVYANVFLKLVQFLLLIGIQSTAVPHCAAGGAVCALPHAAEFPTLSWGVSFGKGPPDSSQLISLSYGSLNSFFPPLLA